MGYRCEATSIEGFVQQVAVSYIANGYFFYVAGSVPKGKDPEAVDQKILHRYEIGISKWAKARRKALGQANLQYIRHQRFFLILATHGRHRFFTEEEKSVRDVRRTPIRFAGYSLSFRNGHASVRLDMREYQVLKSFFLVNALRCSAEWHAAEFSRLSYQPYAPVRAQLRCVMRAVNRERRISAKEPVVWPELPGRRQVFRPFDRQCRSQVVFQPRDTKTLERPPPAPQQSTPAAPVFGTESDDEPS